MKKAFTLIELLVVIAIIALLLSILMPSLATVKELAGSVVCASNEKQILTAWHLYTTENDSMICSPSTADYDPNPIPPKTPRYDWIEGTTNTILEEKINGTAPLATTGNQGIEGGALYSYYEDPKLTHCPSDKRYREPPTDTAYSGDGAYRTYSFIGSMASGASDGCKKTTDIGNPGSKYILVEENDNRGINMNSWVMKRGPRTGLIDAFAVFHNMRSVLGFADGHAEKVVWKDKRTEQYHVEISEGRKLVGGQDGGTTEAEELNNKDFMWLRTHYATKAK